MMSMETLCEGGSAHGASTKKEVKLPHEHPFYFKDSQVVLKVSEIAWFLDWFYSSLLIYNPHEGRKPDI